MRKPKTSKLEIADIQHVSKTNKKPWLTPHEQVEHLKKQGVRFDLMSASDAEAYLAKNNNFFRLRSYRKGFAKVEEGKRKDQYANLDFKMLVDLSIVDMLLRYEMLHLSLDIEHFSKVMLLTRIESQGEDGYEIVRDYIADNDYYTPGKPLVNRLRDEIKRGSEGTYTGDLIAAFPNFDFPIWAFQEVISFGSFIYFVKFCAKRFGDKTLEDDFYLLQNVRSLRNACAHNNCIINDMGSKRNGKGSNHRIYQAVATVEGIGSGQRRAKLSNTRLNHIATTLYLHKERASTGVLEHRAQDLRTFAERMNKNIDYYHGNNQIKSGFAFIDTLINTWYPTTNESLKMKEGSLNQSPFI